MQLKNLNDILREPAIKACLGEDLRLYLLTFLADERGQNIRNTICHGLATPQQSTKDSATKPSTHCWPYRWSDKRDRHLTMPTAPAPVE